MRNFGSIKVSDISKYPELQMLRFSNGKVTKVGMLGVSKDLDGKLKVLLAKPAPKYNAEDETFFAIARGSLNAFDEAQQKWVDINEKALDEGWKKEASLDGAVREAEEELGLKADNSSALYDCGILSYRSETKGEYGIHFFIAAVKDPALIPASTADSRAISWMELEEALDNPELNPHYRDLLLGMVEGYLAAIS